MQSTGTVTPGNRIFEAGFSITINHQSFLNVSRCTPYSPNTDSFSTLTHPSPLGRYEDGGRALLDQTAHGPDAAQHRHAHAAYGKRVISGLTLTANAPRTRDFMSC